jgi:hypothetical protein
MGHSFNPMLGVLEFSQKKPEKPFFPITKFSCGNLQDLDLDYHNEIDCGLLDTDTSCECNISDLGLCPDV